MDVLKLGGLPMAQKSIDPESELYRAGLEVSDRLGRYANDDGWFDEVVRYWTGPDGLRLVTLELSELGQRVADLIFRDSWRVPRSILREMEDCLTGDPANNHYSDYCSELLESLHGKLLELTISNSELFGRLNLQVNEVLAPVTKRLWNQINP
jgi:hypothetical protein